jgi:hypothetical protein
MLFKYCWSYKIKDGEIQGTRSTYNGKENWLPELPEILKASVHSRDIGVYEKIIIKFIFKNTEKWCGPDSSGSWHGRVAGFCEHDKALSGSIKSGKFLDKLSDS